MGNHRTTRQGFAVEIPYTSDRSGFLGWVMGWGVLFFVEGIVVVTLIMVFAPFFWMKLTLTGAFVVLLGWLISSLFRPLRTTHILNESALRLRYGTTRIDIPCSGITRAEAIDAHAGSSYVGVPTPDEATGTLRITFPGRGRSCCILILHLISR